MTTKTQIARPCERAALEPGTTGALKLAVCEETERLCLRELGKHLRAIVLTGSLARDEATVVEEAQLWKFRGDVDFLLFFAPAAALPPDGHVRRLGGEIEAALLRRRISCQVTLSAAHPDYLRRLEPHIFAYELRVCGQVVWGDRQILSLVPVFSPADIPLEDAWRLLSNRMVEQLEMAHEPAHKDRLLPSGVHYRTVKLYLDMATSYLLFVGEYRPTYRERAERLALLAAAPRGNGDEHGNGNGSVNGNAKGNGNGFPFPLGGFSERVAACTQWKLSAAEDGGREAESDSGKGRDFWEEAVRYAHLLWRWELKRLIGTSVELPDRALHELWMRFQPFAALLRGWLFLLRSQGWHRSWRHWLRWSRLGWQASPRYCVYAAASELFFHLPALLGPAGGGSDVETDWEEARRWLPVACAGTNGGGANWQRLASDIVWNYRQFLEGTRA